MIRIHHRQRSNRRLWLTAAAGGLAITTLMGSGLWAVVADETRSQGDSAESGAFDSVDNLRVGLTDVNNSSCNNVVYEEASVFGPFLVANIDLETESPLYSTQKRVCFRVRRSGTYTVRLRTASIVQTETGCTRSSNVPEDRVDSSCASGPGELADVLMVGFTATPIDNQLVTCSGNQGPRKMQNLTTEPYTLCTIRSPGHQPRSFVPYFRVAPDASPESLQRAQSDRVQFHFHLTLET